MGVPLHGGHGTETQQDLLHDAVAQAHDDHQQASQSPLGGGDQLRQDQQALG